MKVVGHKRQREFFQRAIDSDRLGHGYLFSGEDQIGKRSFAFEVLQKIHCEGDLCDDCCRMFEKGTHPDSLFLEPDGGSIKIKEAQKILRHLSLSPSLSPLKTVLIDEAHMMGVRAQNSLLKTLEEPGDSSLIILVTNHPESLLDTILSRLQRIEFFPLADKEMEEIVSDKDVLRLAGGRPGRALELVENNYEPEREEELIEIAKSDIGERLSFAKELSKKNPEDVLQSWVLYFHRLLGERVMEEGRTDKLKSLVKETDRTLHLLRNRNVNKKIVLQSLMLKF